MGMPKSLLRYEDLVGTEVMTPEGMQTVLSFSQQRDSFEVGNENHVTDYYVEDLREEPMPSDPDEMVRWLTRPTWAFAARPSAIVSIDCPCSCDACKRGPSFHIIKPDAICRCQERQCSCVAH